jgi:uncharacterized membrane protein
MGDGRAAPAPLLIRFPRMRRTQTMSDKKRDLKTKLFLGAIVVALTMAVWVLGISLLGAAR